jgi:hypothetical protein
MEDDNRSTRRAVRPRSPASRQEEAVETPVRPYGPPPSPTGSDRATLSPLNMTPVVLGARVK